MSEYRKVIYEGYHDNQVNKGAVDHKALLKQQSYYYRKEIVPLLPKDKRSSILDIGCGFGSFIHAAKQEHYENMSGIDLSPDQVRVAHELGLSEVNLLSADDWFAVDRKVDCIVGIDIIEHFTKDELISFLQNIKRSLNPGGKVILRTPNMDSPLASVYAFADFSHEVFLNKSSALQLLKSCGFRNVEVRESMILNQDLVKETFRKILWWNIKLMNKVTLFASGRTWTDVVFSPNLLIISEM